SVSTSALRSAAVATLIWPILPPPNFDVSVLTSIAAIALAGLDDQAFLLAREIFEAGFVAVAAVQAQILAAALEPDAMLAVLAVIGALGVEIRLHLELVFAGFGGGDRDIHALDAGPFSRPAREAVRRGRGIDRFGAFGRRGFDRN